MAVPSHENRPRPRFRSSISDRLLPGVQRILKIPAPAAGTDWTTGPVPGGRVWRVLLGRASFTTDANAGSRLAHVVITGPDGVLYKSPDVGNVWAQGGPYNATFAQVGTVTNGVATRESVFQIPPVWMPSGFTFGVATSGLFPGDQWSPAQLLIEEVFEAWQDVTLHHLAEEEEALAAAGLLASSVTGRG